MAFTLCITVLFILLPLHGVLMFFSVRLPSGLSVSQLSTSLNIQVLIVLIDDKCSIVHCMMCGHHHYKTLVQEGWWLPSRHHFKLLYVFCILPMCCTYLGVWHSPQRWTVLPCGTVLQVCWETHRPCKTRMAEFFVEMQCNCSTEGGRLVQCIVAGLS